MKTLIQIVFIFLISSLINFGCTFGDKYLGTWENVTDGDQITITEYKKKGNLPNQTLEETVCYDIEYKGNNYYGSKNLGGGLNIHSGFYYTTSLEYEESTGHLKCVGGCQRFDGEWKKNE